MIINLSKEMIPFHNQCDSCIGTGRMGLALQEEYREQLRLVQKEIGFHYIRGHGLFCDDMSIYHEYELNGRCYEEYNFTYLDNVMDFYQSVGLKPFLELGFMPEQMASGSQTVFYWNGNVTPPADYEKWKRLVKSTLQHLIERYGEEEVLTWPIEVWNEPNLKCFWENADREEYFRLFSETFAVIKKLNPGFRVGGPAVCGGTDEIWIRSFLEYCKENGIEPDFITRHHYTTDLPRYEGRYGYVHLTEPEQGFANLQTSRDIIDSFPEFCGKEIHVTEFNTSYIPDCPIHDTNCNAAYIALQLSRLGDVNASYSYWTFGDVFEERGVPFSLFHGGFGLVANGCIPKPTYWTFAFFKKLKGICCYRDEQAVFVKGEDGKVRGVLWNLAKQGSADEALYTVRIPLDVLGVKRGRELFLMCKTVDEVVCNPLKVWHDMGEPANPDQEQVALLKESARPLVTTDRIVAEKEEITVEICMNRNAVTYLELFDSEIKSDRGYNYQKVMNMCAL